MLFWSENLNRENKLGDVLTAAQESNNTGNLFYFEEEKKPQNINTSVCVLHYFTVHYEFTKPQEWKIQIYYQKDVSKRLMSTQTVAIKTIVLWQPVFSACLNYSSLSHTHVSVTVYTVQNRFLHISAFKKVLVQWTRRCRTMKSIEVRSKTDGKGRSEIYYFDLIFDISLK